MNYKETQEFLFSALPMYQRIGKEAFKKDLSNTLALCKALGNPHLKFKSVHVAGTNGKGSSAHMLSAVLQQAGFKVGLYTSPHLKSFTERIRINGKAIPEEGVVDFVQQNKAAIDRIQPSFFEITVVMAFDYFAREEVDIAVIEVGLGGRLDSTNVITPEVSLITNIGFDHMEMLGDTLPKIAGEKAGIIKPEVPVVIGEKQTETSPVFEQKAKEINSKLWYGDHHQKLPQTDLMGDYQKNNIPGVLKTVEVLRELGWKVRGEDITVGLNQVVSLTGLKGRWQTLSKYPLTICDTGHNKEGFQQVLDQIARLKKPQVYMVLGFVNDKNIKDLMALIPNEYQLTFCQANIPRAMPLDRIKEIALDLQIQADYVSDVNEAIDKVRVNAKPDDLVFVGGSTFVVAEIEGL
ncbi:bifunctional folylpolyglutamate synthase/dihydrofolate synthase [Roseivirga misakiensis]|uniref:Dihydrofolate synthase/folylpolyglutamate synthase n=1 Tax=Roseivirga misakiensis TaxID=1563681 RepID=A0A1E5SZW0_9BACT|nr:folylpolyglutamate synthase/dihydrofolate synthase family protein [Roseivirga misakiensis]OEK04645.1 dihydrofolate synthase [Roseivirga misakiensis]